MSPRHTRFKRSLFTALSALAFALCPAIAPREASAAEPTEPAAQTEPTQPAKTTGASDAASAASAASASDADEAEKPSESKKATKKAASAHEKKKKGAHKKEALKGEKAKRSAKKAKAHKAKELGEKERDAKARTGDAPAATKGATKGAAKEREPALSKTAKATEDHGAASKASKATRDEERGNHARARATEKASDEAKTAAKHEQKATKALKKPKKTASRSNSSKRRKDKKAASDKGDKEAPRRPCFGPAVAIDRSGLEGERLSLVTCGGAPIEEARDRLSLLARPWGVARPELPLPGEAKKGALASAQKARRSAKGARHNLDAREADPVDVAPGIRRLDKGLLARIDAIARRFPDKPVSIVSGYRPQSRGSLHQAARAIDLRVAGVANEDLVAFCKTIPDTGCGYYPNSSFVHVDVRQPGTGSVSWIDASGPGEAPRYVTQWPPPEAPESAADKSSDRDREAAPPFVPPGITQAPEGADDKATAGRAPRPPSLAPLPHDDDDDDNPKAPLLEDPPR